jgi:hypothetical protein
LGSHTLTINDIINNVYPSITTSVITNWANSFVPLAVVFADGDDNNSLNAPADVASLATTGWNNNGFSIYSASLGVSSNQSNLRSMAELSNGNHSVLLTGMDSNSLLIPSSDWDEFGNSFLPQGANSVFKGSWSRDYDYETLTWVSDVVASVNIVPNGIVTNQNSAMCNIEFRYTQDRTNWTAWINVASQFQSVGNVYTYSVNREIYGIQYRITMEDALIGDQKPVIYELYHIKVSPSIRYLVTPKKEIDGLLFEYILSANVNIPNSCKVNWGISRGDSIDFNDYESIFSQRKGALSNRQNSISFSQAVTRKNLPHTVNSTGNFVQVYSDIAETIPASWAVTDIVQIWVQVTQSQTGNYETDGSAVLMAQSIGGVQVYQLDNVNGTIVFNPPLVAGTVFFIDIITNATLANSVGENTTTRDNRTYYSVNGGWVYDSTVYVLLQKVFGGPSTLIRGGYYLNPEEGSVTFSKERVKTDIIKLFIVSDGEFRVGAEILSYTTDDVAIDDFGIYYSVAQNSSINGLIAGGSAVEITGNSVILGPSIASVTDNILDIQYTVTTNDESTEQGSIITWWVGRPTFTGTTNTAWNTYDPATGLWFNRISVKNRILFKQLDNTTLVFSSDALFPVYDGRTLSRTADQTSGLFQPGDYVYVNVTPSNGIVFGSTTKSNLIKYYGYSIPAITSLSINHVFTSVVNGVTQFKILKTYDLSPIIMMSPSYNYPNVNYYTTWYSTDNNLPIQTNQTSGVVPGPSNTSLLSENTILGKAYYCAIQPINNGVLGPILYSEPILVVSSI